MGKALKKTNLDSAAKAKLESSGITPAQAAELGIYSVANANALEKQFESQPALVLPYSDIHGKPMRPHKTDDPFYRIRYLGEPKHDFAAAAGAKEARYTQPKGTAVCAYFPSCVDWVALAKDPNEPLLITEGELKAGKASLEGFPTIGLGGIYSFRSTRNGTFFLPELEDINWHRRKVTIVYDSDFASNPQVCAAINTLAEELYERGAFVYVAMLEDVYDDDRKTGLDDFLVHRPEEDFIRILKEAELLGMTKRLWEMNNELVYIRDPGMVVSQKHGQKLDCSKFTAHSDWATIGVPERKLRPDGTSNIVKSSAANTWIKWPLRRTVDKLSYLPGEERFTTHDGVDYLNQWRGWGVKPAKGDVKPWLDLVKFIFKDAEPGAMDWFLDWCAYPIQFPGTKLFSAVIIHGRMTGTGKTLIGYSLARIYGKNFIKIKSKDLYDTWWAENKQFVLGDEISGSDKRAEADMMKAMITQEENNVNIKFIPQFSIPDCVNYYLTSNHCDSLFLEDEDRRFFVHEVTADVPLPDSFYAAYDKWLKNDGGAAALMQWCLDRDLSKFNPKAKAFRTRARDRLITNSKGDLALWCSDLKKDPNPKLYFGKMRHIRDLFSANELLQMYERDHPGAAGKVTANGMSRALQTAGFRKAYDDQPIIGPDGRQARYFVVRNKDKWSKVRDGKQLKRHIALTPVRD